MRAIATGVLIGAFLGGTLMGSVSRAQPAPDLNRAKDLYRSAETAVSEGRFDDAARDFGAAYDITKDPVLFYKIGGANEKAGKCDVALIYYGRYLREARTTDAYVELTRERIIACGGDPRNMMTRPPEPVGSGSADLGSQGSATEPVVVAPTVAPAAGSGAGSAAPPVVIGRHRGAWLLVTGSIAFVTIGSVLAYSANSAEADVADLYVGFAGQPPKFDARTQQKYEELTAEGRRYATLSWISFGCAGVTAIAAGILFARHDERVQVAPTVTRDGAAVSASLRF
jgi:hypothetical protein